MPWSSSDSPATQPATRSRTRADRGAVGSGFGEFFRYHGWLSPGVRLFRSITFPAKSAWVGAAFMVPITALLVFLTLSALEQLSIAKDERMGLDYTRALVAYNRVAEARRVAASMNTAELGGLQTQVQAAFERLQQRHQALNPHLQLDEPFAKLKKGHEALMQQPQQRSPEDTFLAHVELTTALQDLQREVTDHSQLALDPDFDTYHLMTVAVMRGPRLVDNIERVQGLSMLALKAKETRELSGKSRAQIERWSAVHELLEDDVENSYQAVLKATPEVAKLADMKRADEHTQAFFAAVNKDVLGPQLSGEVATLAALGQAAVRANAELNAALLERLDQQLVARIERIEGRLALQIALSVAFVALAAYLKLAFYRVVMGGLREVAGHLEQITQGNLTTHPTPWGRDEAAQLMVTMGQMQNSLRRIVGIVLDGSAQVKSASAEISSASANLSQRTEEAAANLQQTAASMEQISSTVKQTADTVAGAMTIARENAAAATRGGEVIGEVVRTMEGIHGSSRRIGEIIGTIDGIAFQTNILALNAAVEAARAGEQGRGFAVVATEVRALAARSAAAAREIKGLITASIEQVESGNRIAAQAGVTIGTIVSNAERIAGLMGQISSATREQSTGVAQVGTAVQHLDQSTQQNAALVEETSAAAGTLADQSRQLSEEVAFFRVV